MTNSTAPHGDFRPFRVQDIELGIPTRFRQQVAAHPDRVAVWTASMPLSYEALWRWSSDIRELLIDRRGPASEPIGVLLGQGPPAIAAILGILGAGKFYVPLDPTDTPDRLSRVVRDAALELVVTDPDGAPLAHALSGSGSIVLDPDPDPDPAPVASDATEGLDASAAHPAYIYYTSGSTGRPRGVVDSHRNVLHNILRYTNNLRITSHDRLTLLQSPSYSGAVSSLFCGLLNGATVYPYDLRHEGIQGLADLIDRERLTMLHAVPSVFERLVAAGCGFASVRVIRLEGDTCTPRHVALYREHVPPPCILANGLGATETGLSRQYLIDHEHAALIEDVVPVGYPTEDMAVALVDPSGTPVPPGHAGQIVVRSRFLALGYWNDPAATAAAFREEDAVPGARSYHTGDFGRLRDDGCLEYLGRADAQVKIRGHRIPLETVTAALLATGLVDDTAVLALPSALGHPQLVAYVVSNARAAPSVSDLRRAVRTALPAYMIPSRFVVLDRLPLDPNGKVDRRALPTPDGDRPSLDAPFRAPATNMERVVADLWSDLLGVSRVGIHDDFFDLGGDSLLAMALPARLEQRLGVRLTEAALLEGGTVHRMAGLLDRLRPRRSLVAIRPDGRLPPFFCVHPLSGWVMEFRDLAGLLGPEQPFYALQARGRDGGAMGPASVEAMAAAYLEEIHTVQPSGPYALGGWSFGGLVAYDMARQLEDAGEAVSLLVLIDTAFPAGLRQQLSPRRHLTRLARLSWPARAAYLPRRLGRFLAHVWTWLRVRGVSGAGAERVGETGRLQEANSLAARAFRPRRFGGSLLLVCTGDTDVEEESLGWSRVAAGGVRVVRYPRAPDRSEEYAFQEPHLARLARELRARLLEAEGPGGAG